MARSATAETRPAAARTSRRAAASQRSAGAAVLLHASSLTEDLLAVHALGVSLTDVRTLLRGTVARQAAQDRACVLASAVGESAAGTSDIRMSQSLHAMREVLRERLPVLPAAADSSHGLHVDAVLRIDDTHFYVQGWYWDGGSQLRRLTAVSPEGCRVEIPDRV